MRRLTVGLDDRFGDIGCIAAIGAPPTRMVSASAKAASAKAAKSALCESSNQLDLRLQRKSANTGRTVASDVDGNVGICPFKPVAGTRKSNRFVLQPVLRQTSLADARGDPATL